MIVQKNEKTKKVKKDKEIKERKKERQKERKKERKFPQKCDTENVQGRRTVHCWQHTVKIFIFKSQHILFINLTQS